MSSTRIIDKPNKARYKGQDVVVLSTRCPTRYETGAYCDVRFSNGDIEHDVRVGLLTFPDPREEETVYVQTSSGAAMPVRLAVNNGRSR